MNQYLQKISEYHTLLENFISENYEIKPKWTKVISWGYQTTTFYMEDGLGSKYIVRTSLFSPEKVNSLEKAIKVEQLISDRIPTPQYIKNKQDEYISLYKNLNVVLHKHIEGVPPFEMNWDIYNQIIQMLKEIHDTPTQKAEQLNLENIQYLGTSPKVLLHGDVTPSNVLISYGKITGMLDFEYAALGPAEYDLARTAVFCWFRFDRELFSTVVNKTLELYQKEVDIELIKTFSIENIKKHLHEIEKNKENYKDLNTWKTEKEYTTNMVERLTKELEQVQ